MQITLREFQNQDFKALENIIRETWHYDELCSPKTASKLARVYLSSCLTNYTFSRAALDNGVPVGIILAKNRAIHRCPFGNVNGIDQQLLQDCGRTYPAEIALFAVDSSCRGKGIGKVLFQSALDYMKEQKLDAFYLFTDTSCNYGFYEHQGMTRRCEKEHTFMINGQTAKMNFFIYDYYCK